MRFSQRIVSLPEVRHLLHVGGADQAAFEVIRPGVVRALDASRKQALRLGAQPRAAMPADVVKGMHTSRRRARDDQAFAQDLPREELPRPFDLLEAPGTNPHAA